MAFAARNAPNTLADINITPLVDVMLVLLVIFMVTAPMLEFRLALALPQGATPPPVERSEPLELRVVPGDLFVLEGRELGRTGLAEALRLLQAGAPERVLRIRVDPDADYQSAATALSTVRQAGFEHVRLE